MIPQRALQSHFKYISHANRVSQSSIVLFSTSTYNKGKRYGGRDQYMYRWEVEPETRDDKFDDTDIISQKYSVSPNVLKYRKDLLKFKEKYDRSLYNERNPYSDDLNLLHYYELQNKNMENGLNIYGEPAGFTFEDLEELEESKSHLKRLANDLDIDVPKAPPKKNKKGFIDNLTVQELSKFISSIENPNPIAPGVNIFTDFPFGGTPEAIKKWLRSERTIKSIKTDIPDANEDVHIAEMLLSEDRTAFASEYQRIGYDELPNDGSASMDSVKVLLENDLSKLDPLDLEYRKLVLGGADARAVTKSVHPKDIDPRNKISAHLTKIGYAAPKVYEGKLGVKGIMRNGSSSVTSYGTRKTSVAYVSLKTGTGKITVNGRDYVDYFPQIRDRLDITKPLLFTDLLHRVDVNCRVSGGGVSGHQGAVRLGIARCVIKYHPPARKVLKKYKMLTIDSRIVERKKYGLLKARKAPKWRKR